MVWPSTLRIAECFSTHLRAWAKYSSQGLYRSRQWGEQCAARVRASCSAPRAIPGSAILDQIRAKGVQSNDAAVGRMPASSLRFHTGDSQTAHQRSSTAPTVPIPYGACCWSCGHPHRHTHPSLIPAEPHHRPPP